MVLMNITLALGGGGVKGFAHIGVLRVLEREGYHICGIAGTSAGGLVGALYAVGYSPDVMETRLRDIDQGNLFTRMHGDGPSLLGTAGLSAILSELIGECNFDELRVPLGLTAADLTSGLPVIIKNGRLLDAVLATSAVPGIFPAKSIDGHLLVDGGVTNPIPVAEARALYPEAPVVAVILSPPLGWQSEAYRDPTTELPPLMTNIPLIYRLAGRLRLAQAVNIFIHSVDLGGSTMLDMQLRLEKPEVIIRPQLGLIGLTDRVDIPELIKLGEQAAQSALPDLQNAVRWQNRLSRKWSSVFHRSSK
jgi:NTE family protein